MKVERRFHRCTDIKCPLCLSKMRIPFGPFWPFFYWLHGLSTLLIGGLPRTETDHQTINHRWSVRRARILHFLQHCSYKYCYKNLPFVPGSRVHAMSRIKPVSKSNTWLQENSSEIECKGQYYKSIWPLSRSTARFPHFFRNEIPWLFKDLSRSQLHLSSTMERFSVMK